MSCECALSTTSIFATQRNPTGCEASEDMDSSTRSGERHSRIRQARMLVLPVMLGCQAPPPPHEEPAKAAPPLAPSPEAIGSGRSETVVHRSDGCDSDAATGGGSLLWSGGWLYGGVVSLGQPCATPGDALDTALLRRYIKRNLQKLVRCYENALLDKPTLAGTSTTWFEIDDQGDVTLSFATGLDPNVDRCIARTVQEIYFPRPKDDKTVDVTYPFTFRSASRYRRATR
jgi:hypothetical protein